MRTESSTTSRRKRPRRHPRVPRHQVQERLFPPDDRPVFRRRRVRVAVDQRGDTTPYGGLALAVQLVTKLGLDRAIGDALHLLKYPLPYHESDHVLTHAYNLFVGGTCLEDIQNLQHSAAVKSMLGAVRIPDPSTAGDFLRRFEADDLDRLQAAIDRVRLKVWKRMPRRWRETATIDIDSHVKEVFGECKEGADFAYNKKWSYHPLLVTLAETGESLRLINRPGNSTSEAGAAAALNEVFSLTEGRFRRVYLRGDSKFCRRDIVELCDGFDVGFALVKEEAPNVREIAESLPENAWRPFVIHPERRGPPASGQRRRKRPRVRREIALRRGYRDLRTVREWVAETTYSLTHCDQMFRLLIKRQAIEMRDEQGVLFEQYVYRYILSNIPAAEMSAAAVVRFAYGRCHQENAIEQAKNGLHGFRMPTGTLLANAAFLLGAEIAWCLRAWLSLLALPAETVRWEWKWFRQAFVYVGAKVVESGRAAVVRLTASHRWLSQLLQAHERLRRLPA